MQVRIGLHRGSVHAARGDLYGQDVNLAARIAGAARGGEVLISAAVRDALGEEPGVRLAHSRELRLRGLGGT
jgi:adenylate cyclase